MSCPIIGNFSMNVTLHDFIQDIVNDPSTYIDGDVNDDELVLEMTISIIIMDDNRKSVFTKSIVNRFSKIDLEKGTHCIN